MLPLSARQAVASTAHTQHKQDDVRASGFGNVVMNDDKDKLGGVMWYRERERKRERGNTVDAIGTSQ